MGADLLVAERLEHAAYGLALATLPVARPARGHNRSGPVVVACLQQVADGLGHVAHVEVPLAGSATKVGDGVGLATFELGPQKLAEKLVVAIPPVAVVFG